jgi:hypothetical protein
MATFNAPTLLDTQYSGTGPLAVAHGQAELAAADGDKIRLVKLYAGSKIYRVDVVFDDLGTSGTLDIGFEYVNGEAGGSATAFAEAIDVDPAGTSQHVFAPVTLAYDAYIIATVDDAAAAGTLDVMTYFEFKGTK